ncbi:ClpX C4-type zinc finger protein [Streptomyces coacervatus]|uniref:ClpX C4-type zinc finger protein n=1 Tax=Streptomyces coacervatus TaxID=647381 RepID=UPI0034DFCB13
MIRPAQDLSSSCTVSGEASSKKQPDRCSFCGHPRSEERRLVAGPDVWICAECVARSSEILAQSADAGSTR